MNATQPLGETAARRVPVVNWPNALTALRLVLAVVLFVCIDARLWAAGLVVFAVAAVTDWADGYLARLQNAVTSLGRQFDPLVDKVLICGAFIHLLPVEGAGLSSWMVNLVVGRELLVTGLRGYLEKQGVVFGADHFGKLKMVLQSAWLVVVLVGLWATSAGQARSFVDAWSVVQMTCLYGALVVTVVSGLNYAVKAVAFWGEVRD